MRAWISVEVNAIAFEIDVSANSIVINCTPHENGCREGCSLAYFALVLAVTSELLSIILNDSYWS